MGNSKAIKLIIWAALIMAPLLSLSIIGFATQTSLLSIDAWNTTWNDEQGYYWTVEQMRAYGHPQGVAGYNEVAPERPSYGPYSPFLFAPYIAGSYLFGLDTHNFIYYTNIALGILAMILIVVILKPNVRQSAILFIFFLSNFVISRYIGSGMAEAVYIVFAALFASCLLLLFRWGDDVDDSTRQGSRRTTAKSVTALAVMIISVGFWGMMRPYLLVFVLVPLVAILIGNLHLPKRACVALIIFAAVVTCATLFGYMEFSKYYATPYFASESMANSLTERLSRAVSGFLSTNWASIKHAGGSLLKLEWTGITALMFACLWTIMLFCAISLKRQGKNKLAILLASMVVSGLILYEANILLYSYHQIHRTLIVVVVMYVLVLAEFDAKHLFGWTSKAVVGFLIVAVSVCTSALLVHPDQFDLPQVNSSVEAANDADVRVELSNLMPRSDEPWDNTIAHPVEKTDFNLYYQMPEYLALNCCERKYLKESLLNGTLKSKYLCLSYDEHLNELAKSKCKVVFDGVGHTVYQVR